MTAFEYKNQKYFSNEFDQVLRRGTGDMSVVLRITNDSKLLDKILQIFRSLADTINTSLH